MLTRGFIREKKSSLRFEKTKLVVSIGISIGYSILFYLFCLGIREIYRFTTFWNDHDHLLVLTSEEIFFYNFFFAFLATLTGISFGVETFIKTQFHIPRYIRYSIVVDTSGILWNTNYWVLRLGVLFGIFSGLMSLNYHFSFYHDYWILFPLILIILFFNQWLKFRLFIKQGTLKTMLLSFVITVVYSTFLAMLPLYDYDAFNHSILKNTISYNYTIALPSFEYQSPQMRSPVGEIYLGFSKKEKSDSALLAFKGDPRPLSIKEYSMMLDSIRDEVGRFDEPPLYFYADKSLKMNRIKELFDTIRSRNFSNVLLMTSGEGGIAVYLHPFFKEVKPNVHAGYQPSYKEELKEFKEERVVLSLRRDSLFFNNRRCSPENLSITIRKALEKTPHLIIDLEADGDTRYGTFAKCIDSHTKAIATLRSAYAQKYFSKSYDHMRALWKERELYDTLGQVYPASLLFLSDADRKLLLSKIN